MTDKIHHLKKYGAGFPVVLLHGFGEDSTIWNNQTEFLKTHYQVIVPDIPGSGASPSLQGDALIEDYASHLKDLLDKENIHQCIMLGHSMGGYITLAFAEKYADKLKAFGLIHSTAFADSSEKKEVRKRGIETIKEYGAYPFLKTTIPGLFGEAFRRENSRAIDKLTEAGKNFNAETLVMYYRAMMLRPDRTHVLRESRVPVLFVTGAEDKAAPVNDLLQQVHLPQVSYFHVLKNAAHMGMLESASHVNRFIGDFVHESI